MLSIKIYGTVLDMRAIAEIVKYIPPTAQEVKVTSPPRVPIDARPCQHPGTLFLDASVDDKLFIHLEQSSPTAEYTVKST